jgi:hypothetical protein
MNGDEFGLGGISSFAYANNAQPVEKTIVLTPAQLQAIIEQAIKAATAPLVAEIELLKQRLDSITNNHHESDQIQNAAPSESVANIEPNSEICYTLQDPISPSIHPIVTAQNLEEVKSELIAKMDELYVDLQLEIARDRQRITRLETPVYTDRSLKRVDDLHAIMQRNCLRQVTFTQAAKLLGITYRRAKQLRPLIEADRRFAVVKDPRHKTRRLIRLTDVINGGR